MREAEILGPFNPKFKGVQGQAELHGKILFLKTT